MMWKQSVWTSTISSHLAALHLKEGGLLTLAGANAALSGTGGEPFVCAVVITPGSTGSSVIWWPSLLAELPNQITQGIESAMARQQRKEKEKLSHLSDTRGSLAASSGGWERCR